jgi:hypothetical protein
MVIVSWRAGCVPCRSFSVNIGGDIVMFPAKLKIMGHEYEVRVNNEPRLGMATVGTCCTNLLRIEIGQSEPESRQAEAFLHEIFEALNYHLSLGLDHDKQLFPLSEGLFQVLRDNGLDFRR